MTITLPDEMRERVETLAKRHGPVSITEYMIHLIEEAETDALFADLPGPPHLTPRNREELERMLDEGMRSGDSVEADEAFWAERRRRLEERFAARRNTSGDTPFVSQ